MKISYNSLLEFAELPYTPEQTAEILTMLGIEVESIEYQRSKYDNFYIGEALAKEKHPDAKKLSVCSVTTGGEPRQIICGAPNIEVGQRVVVALPGAIVPANGLVIGERTIRGVESFGMICSKAELGIEDDQSGIWVLPNTAQIGLPLADYLQKTDVIYDIGITANRADCLSHIGVARDLAAFADVDFQIPTLKIKESPEYKIKDLLKVEIIDQNKCPRYAARIVRDITITESPAWLQQLLNDLGLRPRNIAVDVANYVMLRCGQPLHTFDYEQLTNGKIIVKNADNNSAFITLDGKEHITNDSMLMICDAEKPVAIAGVMGGQNSEITNSTTSIAIESAYFQPSSIRRTAKLLGVSTDASYRFERGVDYDKNILYALDLAAQMIAELGGGSVAAGKIDIYPKPIRPSEIVLRYCHINELLGISVENNKVREYLKNMGFRIVSENEYEIKVEAPSWRVDMEQEIDLIEEIARLYYYDNIVPATTYTVPNTTEIAAQFISPKKRKIVREFLSRRGFNQTYSYYLTDKQSAAINHDNFVSLANPLGVEFSAMRTSTLPSLLQIISRNIRSGADSVFVFEIGKTFNTTIRESQTFVDGIEENEFLTIALSGNCLHPHWSAKSRSVDFYDAKGIVEELFEFLDLPYYLQLVDSATDGFTENALIINIISENGKNISAGIIGELSPQLCENYDVSRSTYCAVIDANILFNANSKESKYSKLSSFPVVERDAAFLLDFAVAAGDLLDIVRKSGGDYFSSADIFDVFSGNALGEGKKSVGVRMKFSSIDKTLSEPEINTAVNSVVESVRQHLGGILRG